MDTLATPAWILIVGALVVVFAVVVAWPLYQKKQSERLQNDFGPEYGRTVDALGSKSKAESELKAREKRVNNGSTENLRVALRRYRSSCQRLLTL